MADESYWIDRANTAEAELATLRQAYAPALERYKAFKANFGVKESSDGTISIDFDKMVPAIGMESALELRRIIDGTYQISGAAGAKPRVKLASA